MILIAAECVRAKGFGGLVEYKARDSLGQRQAWCATVHEEDLLSAKESHLPHLQALNASIPGP
jgi:hypothetical protein